MATGLAALESLLRDRKLDVTLTSNRPWSEPGDRFAPTGTAGLDETLGGGLRRGHLSEIIGPASSGRSTVLVGALAAATARGEVVALIDTHDRFDPAGAAARGVDLSRLLWIRERGDAARALKALNLVVQAGGFGMVAFDLADVSPRAVRQFPHTTWLRLSRVIEGSQTVLLLLGSERIARSSSGASIALEGEAGARARWAGQGDRARHLIGLEITPRASRFHLRAARYGGQAGEADSAIARSHVAPASALRATARQAPPALRATARQAPPALRASTSALRATVDKPARQA